MAKRIIVLSDGTGNSAAKVWRTNVWRVFESLDLSSTNQVAFYDDGIGTSSFKPFAIFGGIFGYGLKRNVIECYKFLCRNYEPGSEIFGFGFSRGAFTIRVLIELVHSQGLVPYNDNEEELDALAIAAYRAYRKTLHTMTRVEVIFRMLRDILFRTQYGRLRDQRKANFLFVGLWDTVAAYGLPVEEMTRLLSQLVFPLGLASSALPQGVTRACHALALDEERKTFHPMLLAEGDSDRSIPDDKRICHVSTEHISQVWFAGVHANVGGGYPDDSLANVSLSWMMEEGARFGLQFKTGPKSDPDSLKQINTRLDFDGRLYDSRRGLAGYYRYGPRDVSTLYPVPEDKTDLLPKIHYTVFERMRRQVHPYAPIGLPAKYAVVDDKGAILEETNPYETPQQANVRGEHQNVVWNSVFRRSVAYLTIVFLTTAFVVFPFVYHSPPSAESTTHLRPVSDLIRFVSAFLPSGLDFWVNAYARNPAIFLVGLILLAYFQRLNLRLKLKIFDEMRAIWTQSLCGRLTPAKRNFLFLLRTLPATRFVRRAILEFLVPIAVMFVTFSWGIMFTSHFLFNLADAAGLYCDGRAERAPAGAHKFPGQDWTDANTVFDTRNMCWGSGLWLETGVRYEIMVTKLDDWFDGKIPTGMNGFQPREIQDHVARALMTFGFPLRRDLDRPYFRVIARIGSVGTEEEFLDPDPGVRDSRRLNEIIRPNRDGELFLYVNDAVLPIPGLSNFFYLNNTGTAQVKVRRLQRS